MHLVSIPFIAGQWSLRLDDSVLIVDILFVSIPFIAGQWSLHFSVFRWVSFEDRFQSPSLRGSGRFLLRCNLNVQSRASFNPLHCGAVVASMPAQCGTRRSFRFQSPSLRGSGRFTLIAALRRALPSLFQSPSLRGSGRFTAAVLAVLAAWRFQSPSLRGSGRFVFMLLKSMGVGVSFNPLHCGAVVASSPRSSTRCAGSWFQSPSLRGSGRFTTSDRASARSAPGFNPLHCGAVVASTPGRPTRISSSACFNPLHCGAVVASGARRWKRQRAPRVSIPFIAGQWSLHAVGGDPLLHGVKFQSPSLRGSGRFRRKARRPRRRRPVSIPFIAGQWSLLRPCPARPPARIVWFQSPSLRGSGRFGQGGTMKKEEQEGFNPLHCGAVVASGRDARHDPRRLRVSIPFIAGQWSLLDILVRVVGVYQAFQSPSLRGSGRFGC